MPDRKVFERSSFFEVLPWAEHISKAMALHDLPNRSVASPQGADHRGTLDFLLGTSKLL